MGAFVGRGVVGDGVVGGTVGRLVGLGVVGRLVGIGVGRGVGILVGLGVGLLVGDGVGSRVWLSETISRVRNEKDEALVSSKFLRWRCRCNWLFHWCGRCHCNWLFHWRGRCGRQRRVPGWGHRRNVARTIAGKLRDLSRIGPRCQTHIRRRLVPTDHSGRCRRIPIRDILDGKIENVIVPDWEFSGGIKAILFRWKACRRGAWFH